MHSLDDVKFYNEVRSIYNWEAKRTLFKNMDVSNSYYKTLIATILLIQLIPKDGMVSINAREYELVKGDLDDLLNIAN